jgi:WD40 repeat protein
MSAEPPGDGILDRNFVAITTCEFDGKGIDPLPGVADEVVVLTKWLCDEALGVRRFTVQYPELAHNPTTQQICHALKDVEPARRWCRSDAVVLFVSGHGYYHGKHHFIILKGSDINQLDATAVATADVVGWLAKTEIKHLLVIMDMCYAGDAAADTVSHLRKAPNTWLILATAANEPAHTGALTSAISQLLSLLNSPAGTGRQFSHGPYLRVDEFVEYIQDQLEASHQQLANLTPAVKLNAFSRCLPNPLYRAENDVPLAGSRRDLALPSADLDAHWDPRSRGVTEIREPGWLFTGRAELMRKLISAAAGEPGTLLVTGRAGSGKSAALARLVTLSDPEFVARYAEPVEAISDDLKPAVGTVDVAVLATGKTTAEITAQICWAFGALAPGGPTPNLEEARNAWRQWIRSSDEPVTIVIDALDEAFSPREVVNDVLPELRLGDAGRRVRLLVGVRSTGRDGQPSAAGTASSRNRLPPLADLAEEALKPAERIGVDEDPWWNRSDVVDYISSLLLGPAQSPYRTARTRAEAVARVLADAAGASYLVARIAAAALAQRAEVVDPNDPSWRAAINDGVFGVFRDDFRKTLTKPDDSERAVNLLRSVAFARGRGLPWRIWELVANAVADDPARYPADAVPSYGDKDLDWLFDNRIGAYLVADHEDGITVYRLFHDDLRTTLQERWRDFLEESASSGDDRVAVEARIAGALRPQARPRQGPGSGYVNPPRPYVRRHAVEHAAAGNVLDEGFLSAEFLPYVDAPRLMALTFAIPDPDPEPHGATPATNGDRLVGVWRKVAHAWDWASPAANADALAFWAKASETRVSETRLGGLWTTRWAHWSVGQGEIVGRHDDKVSAVAVNVLRDGTPVAVGIYGGRPEFFGPDQPGRPRETVRAWDLGDGTPYAAPLIAPAMDVVDTFAVAVLGDGTLIALTGVNRFGTGGEIQAWNLAAGQPFRGPLPLAYGRRRSGTMAMPLNSMAMAVSRDGTPIAVTSSNDRSAQAWDLAAGSPIGAGVADEVDSVYAAAVLPDGTPIAVTVSYPIAVTNSGDSSVQIWDLAAGSPIGAPLTGTPIMSYIRYPLAVLVRPDAVLIAVTGDSEGAVRVWNLHDGTQIGPPLTGLPGTGAGISAVAAATLPNGTPIAVTGSLDGAIRVWNLAHHAALTGPPHSAADANAVATAVLDGTPFAVTGSRDGTVQVRDLHDGTPIGPSLSVPRGTVAGVNAVATAVLLDGTLVAVTASPDGTVQVWDLHDGTPIGAPLTGAAVFDTPEDAPGTGVAAVAIAIRADGTPIAVTGSSVDRLRVWDLAARMPFGSLLTGHTHEIPVAAAILSDGTPIAVTRRVEHDKRTKSEGYWLVPVDKPSDDADPTVVRAWNLATGTTVGKPLTGPLGAVTAVGAAVLPNGTPIAVTGSSDGTVRVWDLVAGTPIGAPLSGHTGHVAAIAAIVLPDGPPIAVTGGHDATVRAWDLRDGRNLGYPLHVIGPVNAIGIHASGEGATVVLAGGGVGCIDLRTNLF